MLQFAWQKGDLGQHVSIWAVDNHDPDAPFPKPAGELAPTVGRLFSMLFRGNAAVTDTTPSFKDRGLLTRFGTELVTTQILRGGNP